MTLIPFSFEGAAVRVIEQSGEPWFVAADVCAVLEHTNSSVAVGRLDDDEKGVSIVYTPGGNQQVAIINESGLYSLILTSRKPAAKRFKKWITAEVIPAIRKTGGYGAPQIDLSNPDHLLGLLTTYAEDKKRLTAQIEAQAPAVAAHARLMDADGSMCITDAAKHLQIKPKGLFDYMDRNRWTYRRNGCSHRVAYQERIESGLLVHKVTTLHRDDGSDKITEQVRITPKGLAKLAQAINGTTTH